MNPAVGRLYQFVQKQAIDWCAMVCNFGHDDLQGLGQLFREQLIDKFHSIHVSISFYSDLCTKLQFAVAYGCRRLSRRSRFIHLLPRQKCQSYEHTSMFHFSLSSDW